MAKITITSWANETQEIETEPLRRAERRELMAILDQAADVKRYDVLPTDRKEHVSWGTWTWAEVTPDERYW